MKWIFRIPVGLYRFGLADQLGRSTLLLTTRGRKTGRLRVTPVNYLAEGSVMYVLSGMGTHSDWFQNLRANPRVQVQVGNRRFEALAEPIANPAERRRTLYLWLEHDRRTSRPRAARAVLRRIGLDHEASVRRRLEEDPPPPIVALRPINENQSARDRP